MVGTRLKSAWPDRPALPLVARRLQSTSLIDPTRTLSRMLLPIVTHADYDAGFPADHRFPMGKYRALTGYLRASGLTERTVVHTPEPAPAAWLKLAHDATYVDQVLACDVPQGIERDIGFPVGPRVSRRAQLAAGAGSGVWTTVRSVRPLARR